MVDIIHTQEHIATLSLPFLNLEVFADPTLSHQRIQHYLKLVERLWPQFRQVVQECGVYEETGLNLSRKVVDIELVWTVNEIMQILNRQYREKDQSTDVLTFTLLADAPDPSLWLSLPTVQLGSMFISVDWAEEAVRIDPSQDLDHYLMERFVHGLLHLQGMHHDTMPEYEKVVAIQKQVLEATFVSGEAG
jgi:probable rRNA maturation factor